MTLADKTVVAVYTLTHGPSYLRSLGRRIDGTFPYPHESIKYPSLTKIGNGINHVNEFDNICNEVRHKMAECSKPCLRNGQYHMCNLRHHMLLHLNEIYARKNGDVLSHEELKCGCS